MLNKISEHLLLQIPLDSGDVYRYIKKTDEDYFGFGEVYFSFIVFNKAKGWKRHNKMTMNLAVPQGNVKFVFTDGKGLFVEKIIGSRNYSRLTVPPGIWFAFQGLTEGANLIVNFSDIVHDEGEMDRQPLEFFSYCW